MAERLWQPSPAQIENCQLTAFTRQVEAEFGIQCADYSQLHDWSLRHPNNFWYSLWQFSELEYQSAPEQIIQGAENFWETRWFTGARLNFAANLLKRCDETPALIFRRESGERRAVSYRQLNQQVARLSSALRKLGVQPGERVAGIMANTPETVIAMLACASIGAIWSSCSPDFGPQGILERLKQIEPCCVFTTEHYFYKGRWHDCRATLSQVGAELSTVRHWVRTPPLQADTAPIGPSICWDELLSQGEPAERPDCTALPFDHPLAILFSSGTTGAPKCILHTAGGTLLQHIKEHRLHLDLRPTERIFYYTTCGWMMWNWLVSALASQATLVLYDGAPMSPTASQLWSIADQEKVNIFGTSARYLSALEKSAYIPRQHHNLAELRTLLSTGSALPASGFHFAYRAIKQNMLLGSISGGTDIISCFALCCPNRPVYAGQLQCAGLGMAVSFVNEQGEITAAGEDGELVCTQPFPSMPAGFWQDTQHTLYRQAYFAQFPNIWAHGDYGCTTAEGGILIKGRSDATLNPGGVRIGTAEIYRLVEQRDEIMESLCVGLPGTDDEEVVLFVCLRPGIRLTKALQTQLRNLIRREISPRHVPDLILAVTDLPRTHSGKLSELAVKKHLLGLHLTNTSALANPGALNKLQQAYQAHHQHLRPPNPA